MASPSPSLPFNDPSATNEETTLPTSGSYGSNPEVAESSLEPEGRVIRSVSQAIAVAQTDITDAERLIANAQLITNLKQGARPYNPATLRNLNEGHKTNISTRAYATELRRAATRLYTPILTASTLTAAKLPAGWPNAAEKTALYRQVTTDSIRSWEKWDMYVRGLMTEVCDYGYGFSAWPDRHNWRPSVFRMDRGFMPRGTELLEQNPARWTAKHDYKPSELLEVARRGEDVGGGGWNKEAVAIAVQNADLPPAEQVWEGARKWEELIREASRDFTVTKGVRVIRTQHLYVLEATGKVSHYILWPDGKAEYQLLCERLDEYDSMGDFVRCQVFGYGDGTIHGSWGAGHILYDLAVQIEQMRCDNLDNLKMGNKLKIQVPDPKDINQVKLVVNSTAAILSNGTWANNVGGIAPATESYQVAEQLVTRWMQEAIGSYLPPVPNTASRAANQIAGAALSENDASQQDVLECQMKQFAYVIQTISKKLYDSDSGDKVAKEARKTLLEGRNGIALTSEEIDMLVNQPSVQSVTEYTQWAAQQRAAFAASLKGDTRFNQTMAARMQTEALPGGGIQLADELVINAGDPTLQTAQARQQTLEAASMMLGLPVAVVSTDNHSVHLDVLKPMMDQAIKAGMTQQAKLGLAHGAAHYEAGVSLKVLPKDSINQWKSQIATWERAIEALELEQAQQQMKQVQAEAPPATIEQFPAVAAQ